MLFGVIVKSAYRPYLIRERTEVEDRTFMIEIVNENEVYLIGCLYVSAPVKIGSVIIEGLEVECISAVS